MAAFMTEMATPVPSCPMCGSFRRAPYARKHGGSYARCRTCGTVYSDPRPSDETLLSRLNDFAPTVDSPDPGIVDPAEVESQLWKVELVEALPLPGRRLLDVGCGSGSFVAAAAKAGFQAEGHDLAPKVAEAASRHYGLPVHTGPVHELTGQWDVITMWDTLEHVVSPPAVLRHVARLLGPGGYVVILSPNSGGLSARLLRGKWWVYGPADHIVMFSLSALGTALAQAGLRTVTLTTRQLSPPFPPEQMDESRMAMRLFTRANESIQLHTSLRRLGLGDWIFAAAGKPAEPC
jgi:2-polyprenyl-3-methyl-5-hydroxy-6-metoxy-1,4-benzoquinol methylase